MAETRKLRFMVPRGYGGTIIARGALVEVTEPWASRFIADGTAVEAAPTERSKPKADQPKPAAKAKGKKK